MLGTNIEEDDPIGQLSDGSSGEEQDRRRTKQDTAVLDPRDVEAVETNENKEEQVADIPDEGMCDLMHKITVAPYGEGGKRAKYANVV